MFEPDYTEIRRAFRADDGAMFAIYFAVIALMLFAIAGLVTSNGMDKCQMSHSHDTCFLAMNR